MSMYMTSQSPFSSGEVFHNVRKDLEAGWVAKGVSIPF